MIHDHSTHDGVSSTKQTNMATYGEETGVSSWTILQQKRFLSTEGVSLRIQDSQWKNHTHATATQDAISPNILGMFLSSRDKKSMAVVAKHIWWENLQNCLLLEPPRRLRIPRRRTAVAVEDMCDSNKKETFCAVAVYLYFVKDTFVQNDSKTKYRKDSTNIPPQENIRHFWRMPLRFAVWMPAVGLKEMMRTRRRRRRLVCSSFYCFKLIQFPTIHELKWVSLSLMSCFCKLH